MNNEDVDTFLVTLKEINNSLCSIDAHLATIAKSQIENHRLLSMKDSREMTKDNG